jgi:hypothetical protein
MKHFFSVNFPQMAFMMAAVRWHQHQLHTRPYATNTVTGVALMAIGDRIAQAVESSPRSKAVSTPTAVEDGAGFSDPSEPNHAIAISAETASWARTSILSSWSCIISPFWTWWYRMVARRYPGNVPRWIAMTAALSIPFNAAFFSYSTSVEHAVFAPEHERGSPRALMDSVWSKLELRLLPTVATSLAVWVPVNFINFTFVPLHNRNLVASAFACCWNVFLSLQQHGASRRGDEDSD